MISPDGSTLAMAVTTKSGPRLFLRALDSAAFRLVAGSEGASNPFWSPDSRSLGFFAGREDEARGRGRRRAADDLRCADRAVAHGHVGSERHDSVYRLREARRVPRWRRRRHACPGPRAGASHDVVRMAVVSPRRSPLLVLCATQQQPGGSPSRFPRLLRIKGRSARLLSSDARGSRVLAVRPRGHAHGAAVRSPDTERDRQPDAPRRRPAVFSQPWPGRLLGVDERRPGLPGWEHAVAAGLVPTATVPKGPRSANQAIMGSPRSLRTRRWWRPMSWTGEPGQQTYRCSILPVVESLRASRSIRQSTGRRSSLPTASNSPLHRRAAAHRTCT